MIAGAERRQEFLNEGFQLVVCRRRRHPDVKENARDRAQEATCPCRFPPDADQPSLGGEGFPYQSRRGVAARNPCELVVRISRPPRCHVLRGRKGTRRPIVPRAPAELRSVPRPQCELERNSTQSSRNDSPNGGIASEPGSLRSSDHRESPHALAASPRYAARDGRRRCERTSFECCALPVDRAVPGRATRADSVDHRHHQTPVAVNGGTGSSRNPDFARA